MIAEAAPRRGVAVRIADHPFAGSMARTFVRRLVDFDGEEEADRFMVALTEAVATLSGTGWVRLTVELDGNPTVTVEAAGRAPAGDHAQSEEIVAGMVPDARLGRRRGRSCVVLPVGGTGARPR